MLRPAPPRQLEYTDSFAKLSQCLRKAPENTGLAFRVAVQKLQVIVQLLTGEIPPRDVFFAAGMAKHLRPYMDLTASVRQVRSGETTSEGREK